MEDGGRRRSLTAAALILRSRPWLDAEIARIQPQAVVCLGATAAQALLGKQFRVSTERGKFVPSPLAPKVMATVHPSAILRAPDDDTRHAEMARFIDDLRVLAKALQSKRAA